MFENILPGVQHPKNIHSLEVHFPIAFLVGAALFYLLALIFRSHSRAMTAFFLLIVGPDDSDSNSQFLNQKMVCVPIFQL